MKRNLLRFLALLLALVICSMTLISCNDKEKEDNKTTGGTLEHTVCPPYPTIWSLYDKDIYSSFAKVTVESFHDDEIIKYNRELVVLVECTVVEDYYGYLKEGDPLRIPILYQHLDVDVDKVAAEIKRAFSEADYALIYTTRAFDQFYLHNVTQNAHLNYGKYTAHPYPLEMYTCFLINEGKLDIEYLDWFCDTYNNGNKHSLANIHTSYFDDYLWHGMSEEEIATNLRKLSSDIDNNIAGR